MKVNKQFPKGFLGEVLPVPISLRVRGMKMERESVL